MGSRSKWLLLVVLCAVAAALAAGCGSDDSSEDGNATASSNGGESSSSPGVEEAKKKVAEYQNLDREFPAPTEAFDPGTGKIGIISCGGQGTDCGVMGAEAKEAAAAMGWESSPVYDGEFTPAKISGYIQQLVREKVDGIVLAAVDANNVKAAVDAAVKAEIPIACIACVTPPEYKDSIIDVTTGGKQDGDAVGAWVVADSNGEAKVYAYNDPNFAIVGLRKQGAQEAIEKYCPDCAYEDGEFPVTEITKPGPPTWTALLSSEPKGQLDYVMAPYDAMALPAAKTAIQRGRTEIKMTGFDAAAGNVELMADPSSPLQATSSGPYLYAAWSAVDQIARRKAGKEAWDSSQLPVALVTKDNVAEFQGAKKNYFEPPDDRFRGMFKKLWGAE